MVGWGAPCRLRSNPRSPSIWRRDMARQCRQTPGLRELEHVSQCGLPVQDRPLQGHAARGAVLYARNSANCHGTDGQGAELGTNLVEKPALLDLKSFEQVVRDGRGRMPGFASTFQAGEAREFWTGCAREVINPSCPRRNNAAAQVWLGAEA